jgi:hypothetical protein
VQISRSGTIGVADRLFVIYNRSMMAFQNLQTWLQLVGVIKISNPPESAPLIPVKKMKFRVSGLYGFILYIQYRRCLKML